LSAPRAAGIMRCAGKPSHRRQPLSSNVWPHKTMHTPPVYDPEIQPNAESWLELDEQERISLAERFHRRAKMDLPNVRAHAAFHAIVENQVALGVESVVRAIPRLMKQGLSRHDAVHAIASVLGDQLYKQANAKTEDTPEALQARYDSAVERLTAKEWLAKYGAK
jgi:hypothetical protein